MSRTVARTARPAAARAASSASTAARSPPTTSTRADSPLLCALSAASGTATSTASRNALAVGASRTAAARSQRRDSAFARKDAPGRRASVNATPAAVYVQWTPSRRPAAVARGRGVQAWGNDAGSARVIVSDEKGPTSGQQTRATSAPPATAGRPSSNASHGRSSTTSCSVSVSLSSSDTATTGGLSHFIFTADKSTSTARGSSRSPRATAASKAFSVSFSPRASCDGDDMATAATTSRAWPGT